MIPSISALINNFSTTIFLVCHAILCESKRNQDTVVLDNSEMCNSSRIISLDAICIECQIYLKYTYFPILLDNLFQILNLIFILSFILSLFNFQIVNNCNLQQFKLFYLFIDSL